MEDSPEKGVTSEAAERPQLNDNELLMIESWVRLANSWGAPRSVVQIYGFVFVSQQPVTAQDCVDCLKISRSSAGQGLKALKDIGAIKQSFQIGERRETYVIEPDLGNLVRGILEGRLFPAFEDFFSSLDEIEKNARRGKEPFILSRIEKLRRWSTKLNQARLLFGG